MWLRHHELGPTLQRMLIDFPAEHLAVTMTGELADCFETRRDGVCKILDQVDFAFNPEATFVYSIGNRWLSPFHAKKEAWSVAASNWYALATWIGRCARKIDGNHSLFHLGIPSLDLVLDVGSTTVDIVPMRCVDGAFVPATGATTDRARLQLGQLVYTGMQRTPVAAIVQRLQVNGTMCPVMAERFATSDDCYLAIGEVEEVPDDVDSADGRPRTRTNALARLARMVGEDSETLSSDEVSSLAHQVISAQAQQVAAAMIANLSQSEKGEIFIAVSGHGRPLASRALDIVRNQKQLGDRLHVVWLEEVASCELSRGAPATAVAWLLRDFLRL